ncbi:uncharacterized membrane protein YhaH (DUF805 family) [Chryseobacterium ginsenosidimutans]|uniref:DUF805 domain-containing protein n=1 Tax=Chryseobacterium ginsenosidimutans TaxID=687846 RepID=UPI002168A970|nr:DUF805 domain-containing protein [Chryseobacterium ginsenosidimutans]MCS3871151.1 uncharacterized membrane protein YhaH (DUF805 family) [Chryseobacterium ginsenosidimutans]
MFKNVFSTDGRIRRTEFALSYLIYFGVLFFTVILGGVTKFALFYILAVIAWFAGLIFRVMQGAKRCHDLGNSGWFQFIPFYFFIMVFADGERGTNKYGHNPKGIGNYNTIDEIGKKEF